MNNMQTLLIVVTPCVSHTATHCNTRQHIATHCNTLLHTATHCHTLSHTAPHCYTLLHTATHCNTLQHTNDRCHTMCVTPYLSKSVSHHIYPKALRPFSIPYMYLTAQNRISLWEIISSFCPNSNNQCDSQIQWDKKTSHFWTVDVHRTHSSHSNLRLSTTLAVRGSDLGQAPVNLLNRLLIYKLYMSIKTEICGPSTCCLFAIKELFVYFSESHRDFTIVLHVKILSARNPVCIFWVPPKFHRCPCVEVGNGPGQFVGSSYLGSRVLTTRLPRKKEKRYDSLDSSSLKVRSSKNEDGHFHDKAMNMLRNKIM